MSQVASFKRNYEGCKALLSDIETVISSYPCRHRSLADYYKDKDMLLSMKTLLEAIISECPETGSRGGAVFIKDGSVQKENLYYRDYLTITKDKKIDFVKVSPVPYGQKPFEYYLNFINEGELL